MNYQTLIAEHETMQRVADTLVGVTRSASPRPEAATELLGHLATLLRDHVVQEDPILYATAAAARGGRHDASAAASLAQFEALKREWRAYVNEWTPAKIASDWSGFGADTVAVMGRLDERVAAETTVLYSLAVHHRLLATA